MDQCGWVGGVPWQVIDLYHKKRNPRKEVWKLDPATRWDPWKRNSRGWVCKHRVSVGLSLFSTVTVLDYCFNLVPLYRRVWNRLRVWAFQLLGIRTTLPKQERKPVPVRPTL